MKPYVLTIDTHKEHEAVIAISVNDDTLDSARLSGRYRSEDILPEIIRLFDKHSLSLSDIHAISVHTGPGSFTGLRVGIAIARMLGILYEVPVNGRPPTDDIRPEYGKNKYG